MSPYTNFHAPRTSLAELCQAQGSAGLTSGGKLVLTIGHSIITSKVNIVDPKNAYLKKKHSMSRAINNPACFT